ncbi:MAG: hypothetical protein K8S99_16170 [Planctomycetes bacterium]|nr:hypothetical protein [Planctomycetota bacterium]
MSHIVILIHEGGAFKPGYFLYEIAEVWRQQGLRVTVQHGAGPVIEADLAILHVDMTSVSAAHLAFMRHYPKTINAAVVDISKRRISTNLVRRRDGYGGPVIVKTNLNHGGLMEARLAAKRSRIRKRLATLRNLLPWGWRSSLGMSDYPIFDSPNDVPRIVWHNPALVVERFLPERSGEFYCLRTWMFFGDREANSVSYSHERIIKSHTVVRREPVPQVPEELRRMRRELGFDFGKFDYAIVDGRVVLYDANRTPSLPQFSRDQAMERVRLLAEGVRAFL